MLQESSPCSQVGWAVEVGQRLVTPGVTCKGEEVHMGSASPWGARAFWDTQGWRSLGSTHEECMRAGLHTSQGRETCTWLNSQFKGANALAPTHSAPPPGAGSGADRSWKRSARDAAQVPEGSTATLVPTATVPRL